MRPTCLRARSRSPAASARATGSDSSLSDLKAIAAYNRYMRKAVCAHLPISPVTIIPAATAAATVKSTAAQKITPRRFPSEGE